MDKKPFKPGFWSLHAYVYRDKVEAENVLAETLLLALEPFDKAPTQPSLFPKGENENKEIAR